MNRSNFPFNFDPYLPSCLNFLILCLSKINSLIPKGTKIHRHIWIGGTYLLQIMPVILVSVKLYMLGEYTLLQENSKSFKIQ